MENHALRRFRFVVVPAGLLFMASAAVWACQETGPDAPPRENGCIGDSCYDLDATPPIGSEASTDGGTTPANTDPFANVASRNAALLKDGFQFTEGPAWVNGRLLFSDTSAGTIYELKSDNSVSPFRTNAGGPNGNALTPGGKLLTCETSRHRVVSAEPTADASTTPIATSFDNKPLNSPNDIVVRRDGNVYFTDPDYQADRDAAARQDKQALFRITPQGDLNQVKEYDGKPNGLAFTPDQNALYVVDTQAGKVARWSVAGDGALMDETAFVDAEGGDGLTVDEAGNVYVAASSGVLVFGPTGSPLGTISVSEQPSNCTFGGADRKTLYITARKGLYSIHLAVPGLL